MHSINIVILYWLNFKQSDYSKKDANYLQIGILKNQNE